MAPGLGTTLKDAAFRLDDEGVTKVFAKLPTAKLDAAQEKLVDLAMAEALLVNNVALDLKLNAVTWLLTREPKPAPDTRAREPFRTALAVVDLLNENAARTREVLGEVAKAGAPRDRLIAALDRALIDAKSDPKGDAARAKKHVQSWKRALSGGADDGALQRTAAADLLQRGAPNFSAALPVFDKVRGKVALSFQGMMRVADTIVAMAEEGVPEEVAEVCEFARRILPKLDFSEKVMERLVKACTQAAKQKKDKKALAVLARL
jgi:hypothetical protein